MMVLTAITLLCRLHNLSDLRFIKWSQRIAHYHPTLLLGLQNNIWLKKRADGSETGNDVTSQQEKDFLLTFNVLCLCFMFTTDHKESCFFYITPTLPRLSSSLVLSLALAAISVPSPCAVMFCSSSVKLVKLLDTKSNQRRQRD